MVWTLDRVVLRRGEFELGPIDLTVSRGDRLLLAGDNGTGKTTLLAAMLGELPVCGPGVRRLTGAARADRPGAVAALLATKSVVDVVRSELGDTVDGRRGAHPAGQVRTRGRARGPTRPQPVARRAHPRADGALPGPQVNVLVLDEPTNHLDVPAIEQLESALADYTGTLVVVSHDQAFLERVGIDRVLELG